MWRGHWEKIRDGEKAGYVGITIIFHSIEYVLKKDFYSEVYINKQFWFAFAYLYDTEIKKKKTKTTRNT